MQQIIVETFWGVGEKSRNAVRVRPLKVQDYSTELRVSFPVELRDANPVGSLFKAWVTLTECSGTPFLRASPRHAIEVVTWEQAHAFIQENYAS